jgi:uncharacterized protein YndB with AHSA1/START domain
VNLQIRPAPVRKTVTVKASPARAFEVFTSRMISWWRPDHHIGPSPLKDVVLEPRLGGRWYEVDQDGSVCEWGKVLVYEPPSRIVLAWQLNQHWQYDPNLVTELEVRFVAEGALTRIEGRHSRQRRGRAVRSGPMGTAKSRLSTFRRVPLRQ